MNAFTDTQITEVQRIERALDELLKTAINTRAPWPPRHDGPVSISVLVAEGLGGTPAARAANSLLDNPVGEAVRKAVTTLGERLYEIGGLKLMSDVLDRVAERDPGKESWRIDIMDKRFDGIGREGGKSGWCS